MSRRRPLVHGVLAAALVIALTAPLPSTAFAKPTSPTEQQIFAQLGVDSVPADYVVLVDTSTSMKGERYDRVRSTLSPFIAGTKPVDHIAIYTFDSKVVPRYVGPGGDAEAALAFLPSEPDGRTDIGGAISSALDELGRPGASQVGSIVLLTDGKNHPPDGSPYADERGPAWAALTNRAAQLASFGRTLRGYSLPLTSDAEGAQLLKQVVPETTLVNPAAVPDIEGFLDRTKRSIKVEKAKRVLSEDIGRGVAVDWPEESVVDMQSGQVTVDVTMRSQATKMPLTVSGVSLRVADAPTAHISFLDPVPADITLKPGEAKALTVLLRWNPGPGWILYQRRVSLEPTLTIDATVSSPWSAPLKDAGLDLAVPAAPADATQDWRLERIVGFWWVLPALAALIVLLVAVLLIHRHLRMNPTVRGSLLITPMRTGETTTPWAVQLRRGPTPFTVPATNGGMPGRGAVRPARTNNGDKALAITYSPDGSESRESTLLLDVAQRGAITIGGVDFSLH
jgi:hypothetical protein